MEGAKLKKQEVEVIFHPAYDESTHSGLTFELISSLKRSKKEIFNIIDEGSAVISLIGNKDVKSIKWV